MFFKNRWGRGQPDDIGAINLGDEKFDPDSDKKPRAGQILWIRGLTRLQTQVTILMSLIITTQSQHYQFLSQRYLHQT
ncbi:GSCOCG00000108001-RA-CDS [Cotesia congregata]|nr:GSCOCG00000108001-RA-CDS [Cotesia congregata]